MASYSLGIVVPSPEFPRHTAIGESIAPVSRRGPDLLHVSFVTPSSGCSAKRRLFSRRVRSRPASCCIAVYIIDSALALQSFQFVSKSRDGGRRRDPVPADGAWVAIDDREKHRWPAGSG
jgi:hypothetical protein